MKNRDLIKIGIFAGLSLGLVAAFSSCRSIPRGAVAVKPFDSERYLGNWFEIARLDIKQERNLSNTTANYALNGDGSIAVVNRGYDTVKNEWKEAKAKAKFRGARDEAALKVSFFGPFYSGYNVIAIDPDYRYAMVAGKNLDYLWLLSREKTIPENIKEKYLQQAGAIGYKTDDLIWVDHNKEQ